MRRDPSGRAKSWLSITSFPMYVLVIFCLLSLLISYLTIIYMRSAFLCLSCLQLALWVSNSPCPTPSLFDLEISIVFCLFWKEVQAQRTIIQMFFVIPFPRYSHIQSIEFSVPFSGNTSRIGEMILDKSSVHCSVFQSIEFSASFSRSTLQI